MVPRYWREIVGLVTSVEQWTENPRVGSSNPPLATNFFKSIPERLGNTFAVAGCKTTDDVRGALGMSE